MPKNEIELFQVKNNFEKTKNIPSILIKKAFLNFQPIVTIAIPTFRRTNLLKEAILSALNQRNFKYYEILILDNNPERDCDTEKYINSLNSDIISYYKNSENLGMAGNWNRLFELSKSKYVVMLHDDDLLLPNFLNDVLKYSKKLNNVGILKPKNIFFKDKLTSAELNYYDNDSVNYKGLKIFKHKRIYDIDNYEGFILGAPTGTLFNKEYVKKIGGFNSDFYPSLDYYFIVLFSHHFKVYILKKNLFLYRWSDNESLKPIIIEKFINDAYLVRKSILTKFKIPYFLHKCFLFSSTVKDIYTYKKINDQFNFDIQKLHKKKYCRLQIFINNIILKMFVKVIKITKYFKQNSNLLQ